MSDRVTKVLIEWKALREKKDSSCELQVRLSHSHHVQPTQKDAEEAKKDVLQDHLQHFVQPSHDVLCLEIKSS